MLKKIGWTFLLISVIGLFSISYAGDVPSRQEDRERLIRIEEGQKSLLQRIEGFEKRIDSNEKSINQRIDDFRGELKGEIQALRELIYVVIGGIFVLIGFVIWDRRTALSPAIRRYKELEEREELLEKALKEYAKVEPRFLEILKSLKLM
jgi:chaperonin cofactor prefoldin